MQYSKLHIRLQISSILLIAIISSAQADPADSTSLKATPYRPTVGSPAELSTPQYLELEGGWLRSNGDGYSNQSVQYLSKYAFNDNWGVLLGGDLWTSQRSMGDTNAGFGDTYLLLKHKFDLNLKNQGIGYEVGVNLPTSKNGLGSEQTDWLAKGIYSLILSDNWRIDTNLGITHLGTTDAHDGRNIIAWSSGLAYSIGNWGWALELSGTQQAHVSSSSQVLAAVSYAISPTFVVDLACARMQQGQNDEHSIGFGATWLISK